MAEQLGFIFDPGRCSGCMACVVACEDQNDLPGVGPAFRQVTKYETADPSASITYLSLACQHCGDAPCLKVCPAGAIFRRENGGMVDVDRNLCIGCRMCAMACPFGAIHFLADGKMAKCHFCYLRQEYGYEPACVRTCPTKALTMGPVESQSAGKAADVSKNILKTLVSQSAATSG